MTARRGRHSILRAVPFDFARYMNSRPARFFVNLFTTHLHPKRFTFERDRACKPLGLRQPPG